MRHVAGVVAALLLIWIAIGSPLATLHHASLTAHMLQHLLLMSVAPPLVWLYLPAVPTAQRWRKIQRAMTHPALCWSAATIVLVAWHVPALFTLAVESRAWHVVQQASFLIAGLLFWWPVIRPWRIAEGTPSWSMVLYLFLATLPCDILAAYLVFSERVAYPVYLSMPRHSGLSVLDDQQLAGALMWTVVTIVYLAAGVILSTRLLSPQSGARAALVPSGGAARGSTDTDPRGVEVA
jgi:cytochrome c oxidase assembly factor CtaG